MQRTEISVTGEVTSQAGSVSTKTTVGDEKRRQCPSWLKKLGRWFHADSYAENGPKRLVSIDVLRGLSMWLLSGMGDIGVCANMREMLKKEMPAQFFAYVLAIPIYAFAHWRGFFLLLSGLVYSFANAKRSKSFKQLTVNFLTAEAIAIVIFWVLFCCDQIQQVVQSWSSTTRDSVLGKSPSGLLNVYLAPWFRLMEYVATPMFFGGLFAILILLRYIMDVAFHLMNLKRKNELRAMAAVWVILAAVVFFTSNAVHFSVYQHLTKKFGPGGQLECPATYYYKNFGKKSSSAAELLALSFFAGKHSYMFPWMGCFFLGCAVGCFYAGVQESKTALTQEQWTHKRKTYLWLHAFFFVVPLIFLGFQSLITVHDVRRGQRTKFQHIGQIVDNDMWFPCQMPELVLFDLVLQFIVLFVFVLIFETASRETAVKHLNRTVYLRRYSTGSLTVYVYSMFLSGAIRKIFKYNPNSVGQLYGALVIEYIVQFILLLYLDSTDWMMTPDWVISSLPRWLTRKFSSNNFARKNHLKVQPVTLFEKQLESREPGLEMK